MKLDTKIGHKCAINCVKNFKHDENAKLEGLGN